MSWPCPVNGFFLFVCFFIAWQRTHSSANQPQVSESMVSYRKGISQRNLAMKVLEPIPLQTAGFVQACQHLLDLFTCCSQMLSVQSPTEAVRCTFPKHSLRVSLIVANRCWTTGIHIRVPSSVGGRKEKPGPSLSSSDTLVPLYLFTDDTSKRKMAADEDYVTYVNAWPWPSSPQED